MENPYHWNLYWHQLDLVLNQSNINFSDKIVEVGIGSGLTSSYLKRKGYDVTTIDIDKNKNPDLVMDITVSELPEANMYIAFEIFEHIPLESARKVWKKLSEKKVSALIFSIPYAYRTYLWMDLWSPFLKRKNINLGRKRNHINSKHHFWELGIKGTTPDLVKNWLAGVGFGVKKDYRFRNHHFFLCELKDEI